mgnify:CR=1 FL=1
MLLFGAPGVGKGTFAKLIQKDFAFKPFSTGDYFRQVIKMAQTSQNIDPFTARISEILNSGQLVDDQIVIDIVKQLQTDPENFLGGEYASTPGLILDGVPRTLRQAQLLMEFSSVDLVINFFNKDEVLIQKMAGRRVCPDCQKNFNVASVITDCGYHMAPLLPRGDDPTICDGDHTSPVKLITRKDDTAEVISERLEIYKDQTLPILQFFKEQPGTKVIDFEAKRGKADYPELRDILFRNLKEELKMSKEAHAS